MRMWTAALAAAGLGLAAAPALAQETDAIDGARDWRMVAALPGVPYTPCVARAEGPDANSMLFLNNDGKPVITLARDWTGLSGQAAAGLSIDGAPPEPMTVSLAANLVLAGPFEPAQLARLRAAQTLDWTLPWGRFHTNVQGFGAALDTVVACRANGPITAG